MTFLSKKPLVMGDLVAKLPIVQGGMGVGVSLSGLASAVANQGGVGVIATAGIGMFEKDFAKNYLEANVKAFQNEIRKAREMSKGIIGANIMVALTNFADFVKTAIEEEIDVIFSGAGMPLNLPQFLTPGKKTKLVPIVSSARAVQVISKRWLSKFNYAPDAFVLEGPKAGGHLGFKKEQLDDPDFSLEKLVREVLPEIKKVEEASGKSIPLIAAGGIYTGEDIFRFLEMGVSAVQMGTKFVTTEECDAEPEFKQTYLDASAEDITIIKSPIGLPGRAVINEFVTDVESGKKKPFNCPFHCIITCDVENSPYCIALALINAQKGRLKHGFAFAGENAYRATEISTVERIFHQLGEEYDKAYLDKYPQ